MTSLASLGTAGLTALHCGSWTRLRHLWTFTKRGGPCAQPLWSLCSSFAHETAGGTESSGACGVHGGEWGKRRLTWGSACPSSATSCCQELRGDVIALLTLTRRAPHFPWAADRICGAHGPERQSLAPWRLPEYAAAPCANLGHASPAEAHGQCSMAPELSWSLLLRAWCSSDRCEGSRGRGCGAASVGHLCYPHRPGGLVASCDMVLPLRHENTRTDHQCFLRLFVTLMLCLRAVLWQEHRLWGTARSLRLGQQHLWGRAWPAPTCPHASAPGPGVWSVMARSGCWAADVHGHCQRFAERARIGGIGPVFM